MPASVKAAKKTLSSRRPAPQGKRISVDISARFGRRVKELRVDRGIKQYELAKNLGIDRSYLSDLERGRKAPSLPMMEVIALGLRITLSDLLEGF